MDAGTRPRTAEGARARHAGAEPAAERRPEQRPEATVMDTASVDSDYQVTVFEEDDDPETLIGEAVEYDLSTDEEQ
ncbi:hypothetical protein [Micromonospora sp. RTP1Z1]|uniref:hypothetical protein n=1 Tax=Micromonospora sp. RTP1Z1 TaxID=2994043 RepID=UPI0029C6FD61|nr:hypothetical protein [Micromonospora sp. RTP1Z1]